jgi:lipoprotein-releasing system permease protein
MTDAAVPTRPSKPFSGWELGLALRYLRARKVDSGVALISIIAFAGIMLAVAVLIIVMSVMNGFRSELLGRIVGFNGHIYVQGRALDPGPTRELLLRRIQAVPQVTEAVPVTENQAMIIAPSGQVGGALVRGLSNQAVRENPLIVGKLTPRGVLPEYGRGEYGGDVILVGERMAAQMAVSPGDQLTIVSPSGSSTAFGSEPTQKGYLVGGTFSVGMAEYDQSFIFMPLEQAQLFFGKEEVWDFIEVKVKNPDQLDRVKAAVTRAAGPGVLVTDWRDRNASFFNALQVERNVMRLIMMLIVLIAAMNIISGLIMLVKNKGRDIAILRTMGASRGAILRVFILAGSIVGMSGTVIGLVIGVLFCIFITPIQKFVEWVVQKPVFSPDVYYLSYIPAKVEWAEVAFVVAWTLFAAVAATLWPAWRASRLDPVEALRYE